MRRVVIIVTALVVLFIGCSKQEQQGDLYTIKIDHDAMFEGDIYDISHIFTDDIDVIPLQTLDNVLLEENADYKICDGDIFIASGFNNGELYRFGTDGKLKNSISRTGRGPGELISVIHWEVIEDSVLFFQNIDSKYLIYSLDGSGFREIMPDENYPNIERLWYNDGILNIITYQELYKLMQYDVKTGVVEKYMKCDTSEFENSWDKISNYSCVHNNILHFLCWANDTIYAFDGEKVQPRFCFDFAKKVPLSKMKSDISVFFRYVTEVNVVWHAELDALTDKYLFIKYHYGAPAYVAIHNMDSGETFAASVYMSDGLPVYDFRIVGDKCYFMVGVSELMELIPEILENPSVNDKVKEKLKALYSQIGEDDNPVIFVKRFK